MRRLITILLLAGLALPAYAEEQPEQVRIYTTREERRDAGIRHEVTDWLTLSGLLELEAGFLRTRLDGGKSHSHDDDFDKTLQIGALLTPLPWMKAELIYEYDDEENEHVLDEAFVSFEAGDLELEVGKLYVPFGVYYSNFVTGPVLEFGETRDRGAILAWGLNEHVDLSGFLYQGRARKAGNDSQDLGWGFAAEGSVLDFGSFGVSYISDLADSREGLLSGKGDRYERRVDGISGHLVLGYERLELSMEFVRALGAFRELDADRDRPRAWNVELGFFPQGRFEWVLRIEGSNELEDEPKLRGGPAVAWRVTKNASLTLEYLYSTYDRDLAEDSNGRALDASHEVAAQLSLQF